jgi:TonB-linked SusC/RagA family outer membrane protein
MMSNLLRVLTGVGLLLGVLPAAAAAQQGTTVSGRVTNDADAPVQGASVAIAALGVGTYTNAEGRYSFIVPAAKATGQNVSIAARRIGYQPRSATVTLTGATVTHDFRLSTATTQLEGVVVTALGLEREKRSLGVAAQSVAGNELNRTQTPNIVNALSGKVAGVKVVGSTNFGGSARIVVRGESSIGGNNQPLWVVDGVAVDNSNITNSYQARGYGGFDYGNAIQDLNSEDVESISVLKGPAAAALYGSRAANGAIVVTTKSGRARGASAFSMTASTNATWETISKLPSYQNEYGQGAGGEFQWVDGAYGGIADGEDASWGPKLDGTIRKQFFGDGPWVAHPDNVRNFFNTGRTLTSNVAATGSSEQAAFRVSVGTQDQSGVVPTSTSQRITTAANGTAQLSDKLSINATAQYVRNRANNRPGTGYDELNPMMGFVWFGRQVDTELLKNYKDNLGNQVNWNYYFHTNPYWALHMNNNQDERNRVLGNVQMQYKPTTWLTGMVRTGTDFYRNNRVFTVSPGWIGGITNWYLPSGLGSYSGGGFDNVDQAVQENNTDFLLTSVSSPLERLGLTLNLGGNRRVRSYHETWIGTDTLVVPGNYNISNSGTLYTPYANDERRAINSLYGSAQFAYNDYFFVDVTGRNDWSSTLPQGKNSYFYPSISSSLIFTDLFPSLRLGQALSYGKLRGAWTRVGSDADPYLLALSYPLNTPFGTIARSTVPNVLPNAALRPERTEAWEVGTELSFLDGRAGVDFTYYRKKSTDQILQATVSPTSGYSAAAVNAGQLSNSGIELQVSATPIKQTKGLTWDVTANYGKNNNKLESLVGDAQTYQIGPTFFSTTIEARVGEPYGVIVGKRAQRIDGKLVLSTQNGLPLPNVSTEIIGRTQPNWTGGLTNTFHYGAFELTGQIDARIGGQLWSATNRFGTYAGILESTLQGRETGIDLVGVTEAGKDTTTHVAAEDYFKNIEGIEENFVYDAGFVKLRELRLGWSVPESLTRRLAGYRMNVALVGRNLWTHSNAPNIDPETAFSATNQQGLEFGQLPPTRSIGFQINITP